ncbi:hypothetical protein [Virgibacillus kimchii]
MSKKGKELGEGLQQIGNSMMGCGCLLTIFITIPILLLLFFL